MTPEQKEAAPVQEKQKTLSKKEQKKRELEELEALLGGVPAATETQAKTEESKEAGAGAAGEGKKKKKKNKGKAEEGE